VGDVTLHVTSTGTVWSPHSCESRDFVGPTDPCGRGPHREVEPGATPLLVLRSARVAPGSTELDVNTFSCPRHRQECCHRARRRQGCPSLRSAAARGAHPHLSMALARGGEIKTSHGSAQIGGLPRTARQAAHRHRPAITAIEIRCARLCGTLSAFGPDSNLPARRNHRQAAHSDDHRK